MINMIMSDKIIYYNLKNEFKRHEGKVKYKERYMRLTSLELVDPNITLLSIIILCISSPQILI